MSYDTLKFTCYLKTLIAKDTHVPHGLVIPTNKNTPEKTRFTIFTDLSRSYSYINTILKGL